MDLVQTVLIQAFVCMGGEIKGHDLATTDVHMPEAILTMKLNIPLLSNMSLVNGRVETPDRAAASI